MKTSRAQFIPKLQGANQPYDEPEDSFTLSVCDGFKMERSFHHHLPQSPNRQATSLAAERLKELQSLYDQGLINKEELDQNRKEILD